MVTENLKMFHSERESSKKFWNMLESVYFCVVTDFNLSFSIDHFFDSRDTQIVFFYLNQDQPRKLMIQPNEQFKCFEL
jgi:hypothetical protein